MHESEIFRHGPLILQGSFHLRSLSQLKQPAAQDQPVKGFFIPVACDSEGIPTSQLGIVNPGFAYIVRVPRRETVRRIALMEELPVHVRFRVALKRHRQNARRVHVQKIPVFIRT